MTNVAKVENAAPKADQTKIEFQRSVDRTEPRVVFADPDDNAKTRKMRDDKPAEATAPKRVHDDVNEDVVFRDPDHDPR